MPTVDPAAWTSLANVKEVLKITDVDRDSLITNIINRSYKILETYLGRVMKSATYTEYYDGDGSETLLLEQYPIISVTSLYDDPERVFGSDTLLDPSNYLIYKERGSIKLYNDESVFMCGLQNIKVIYVAGYATMPGDLEDACIQMAETIFNRVTTGGFDQATLGQESQQYDKDLIPYNALRTLQGYKKYGYGSRST